MAYRLYADFIKRILIMWSYEKNVGNNTRSDETVYYDFAENPNLNGWTELHECRECKSSFSSACFCWYTVYKPNPSTIPSDVLEAENQRIIDENKRIEIEKIKEEVKTNHKNVYINLRKLTNNLFAEARYRIVLKSKTLNDLILYDFVILKRTKRIIKEGKTWVIVKPPNEYKSIPDLKVILKHEVKRFTGKEEIERIYI